MLDPLNTGSGEGSNAWGCWGRVALIAVLFVAGLTALGLLSDFLSTPAIDSEIQQYLEDQIRKRSGSGASVDPCWVGGQDLGPADPPRHFGEGPDWRPESRLDDWFFRPGFVLRPGGESSCGAEAWGYVETRSTLPFFVRSHYGYFSDPAGASDSGDDESTETPMANEGVRTYFTVFGKSFLLNEWSVREREQQR